MKIYSARFITENKKEAYGYFSVDDKNKVHIRIESEDQETIDEFGNSQIINCFCEYNSYFFIELVFLQKGAVLINNHSSKLYYLELDSYTYAKGVNCFNLDDLKIESVIVPYNNLGVWYKGTSRFAIDYDKHLERLKKDYIGAHTVASYEINNDVSLTLQVSGTQLVNFEEVFQIGFCCKTLKYSDYFEYISSFGRFLSLMCNITVEPQSPLTFFLDNGNFTMHRYKWMEDEKVYPHNCISYQELKSVFGEIIKNYYNKSNLFSAVQNIVSSLYIPSSTIGGSITQFLNYTKAIEALYSTKEIYDFTSIETDYRATITTILNKLKSANDRKFLDQKLSNAHRASFKMRLVQFLTFEKNIFLQSDKEIALFAKMIRDTRNYYTHIITDDKFVIKEEYLSLVNSILLTLLVHQLLYVYNNKNDVEANFNFMNHAISVFIRFTNGNLKLLCKG